MDETCFSARLELAVAPSKRPLDMEMRCIRLPLAVSGKRLAPGYCAFRHPSRAPSQLQTFPVTPISKEAFDTCLQFA